MLHRVRVISIHGLDEGLIISSRLNHTRIYVGHGPVPQSQELLNNCPVLIQPRLLAVPSAVGGMQLQNWRKGAELDSAGVQLAVSDSLVMATDIMTLPAVSYIRGCGSKLGLKLQTCPRSGDVPRKA